MGPPSVSNRPDHGRTAAEQLAAFGKSVVPAPSVYALSALSRASVR